MFTLRTRVLLFVSTLIFSQTAIGQSLTVTLLDQNNNPLADAVVELIASNTPEVTPTEIAHVAQEDLTFVPFVTAVQRGSLIDFPNRDKTRHHVYSFSDAKTFEIQLYSGKLEKPILFDNAGVVVLGCNIHDYMLAYIYIGESPLLAVTDENGQVTFANVPEGEATIKLWHPWQLAAVPEQSITLPATRLEYTLAVADNEKPSAPKRGFGR